MPRGDVVRIQLPRPDSSNPTRLQRGTRPAVIVQSDKSSAFPSVVLIVPATTNLAAMKYAGSVLVKPDQTNGLTQPTVFIGHQLGAAEVSMIAARIGQLSSADMEAIDRAIAELLDLDIIQPVQPSTDNSDTGLNTGGTDSQVEP